MTPHSSPGSLTKVFNIGLSRTGTTSFHHAMLGLGYRSIHNPPNVLSLDQLMESAALEKYDAFSDAPFYGLYREVFELYPSAKFVLTTRDMLSWIKSQKYMFSQWRKNWGPEVHQLHRKYLLTDDFNQEKLTAAYQRHNENVSNFFNQKGIETLRLDLSQEGKFETLAAFLGRAAPASAYPHANRSFHPPS